MAASPHLRELRGLDPERDAERIVFVDGALEFPWDTQRALELAFFRSFAVPSIARLLASTGELTGSPQKRYDDTQLLIAAFCELGLSSSLGRGALRRMNTIHARFEIPNEDYLYVLSTMVFEPIRWNARYGWRRLLDVERLGNFHFWRAVGRHMGIRDLPDDLDAFEEFNVAFERDRFAYSDEGHRVAVATRELYLDWFPGLPRPLGRALFHAVLDEPLLDALGLPRPPDGLRAAADAAIRARARAVSLLPARRRPRLRTLERQRSYPDGYRLEELGPGPSVR